MKREKIIRSTVHGCDTISVQNNDSAGFWLGDQFGPRDMEKIHRKRIMKYPYGSGYVTIKDMAGKIGKSDCEVTRILRNTSYTVSDLMSGKYRQKF